MTKRRVKKYKTSKLTKEKNGIIESSQKKKARMNQKRKERKETYVR